MIAEVIVQSCIQQLGKLASLASPTTLRGEPCGATIKEQVTEERTTIKEQAVDRLGRWSPWALTCSKARTVAKRRDAPAPVARVVFRSKGRAKRPTESESAESVGH